MIATVRAIPEVIKNWRENREQLYDLVGFIAAMLVVIALVTGSRPAESIAMAARGIGLASVADWLTVSAPPMLGTHVAELGAAALAATVLLFIGMIVVPLVRGCNDESRMFGYEFLPLIGSPAAVTCWVLLAVAVQHGDPAPSLMHWAGTVASIALWIAIAFGVTGLLYLFVRRYRIADFPSGLLHIAGVFVFRVVCGFGLASFAFLNAGAAIPLSIAAWASRLESDSWRKISAQIARERADREQPTGAVVAHLKAER